MGKALVVEFNWPDFSAQRHRVIRLTPRNSAARVAVRRSAILTVMLLSTVIPFNHIVSVIDRISV